MEKLKVELDLANVLKSLTVNDLEALVKEASALIARRKATNKKRLESELLYQLNNVYVPSKEHLTKFFTLVEKRDKKTITSKELQELQILVDEEEAFQVERIKVVGKLGQLWNMPTLQVVKKLGLKPIENA